MIKPKFYLYVGFCPCPGENCTFDHEFEEKKHLQINSNHNQSKEASYEAIILKLKLSFAQLFEDRTTTYDEGALPILLTTFDALKRGNLRSLRYSHLHHDICVRMHAIVGPTKYSQVRSLCTPTVDNSWQPLIFTFFCLF